MKTKSLSAPIPRVQSKEYGVRSSKYRPGPQALVLVIMVVVDDQTHSHAAICLLDGIIHTVWCTESIQYSVAFLQN